MGLFENKPGFVDECDDEDEWPDFSGLSQIPFKVQQNRDSKIMMDWFAAPWSATDTAHAGKRIALERLNQNGQVEAYCPIGNPWEQLPDDRAKANCFFYFSVEAWAQRVGMCNDGDTYHIGPHKIHRRNKKEPVS